MIMLTYYNECKHCGVCTKCGAAHIAHLICDNCSADVDKLYEVDGDMLCKDCVAEVLQDYSECLTDDDGNDREVYVIDDTEYSSVDEFIQLLDSESIEDYRGGIKV